jgi:EPS-associated MarR family transcriptional regulator
MNKLYEQEIRYSLLKILARHSNLTQREMARKMEISLGKVNYCLSELAKKGLIKIKSFRDSGNKIRYAYLLTPRGMEEKARLTLGFLRRKMVEYKNMREEIEELAREVEKLKLEDASVGRTYNRLKGVCPAVCKKESYSKVSGHK